MSTNGIFIKSDKSDESVIEDCTKLIQAIQPGVKVTGLKRNDDDLYEGIKVFFDCVPTAIRQLVKRKLLNDQDFTTIHSLTTALGIEDAFPTHEDPFKRDLQFQIEDLAPVKVLGISKVPVSPNRPGISSGKWIIELDIPEVEGLFVFCKMGLPNRMELTSPVNGERIRVRFYCRLCGKLGHVQWRCVEGASTADSVDDVVYEPIPKRIRIDSGRESVSDSRTTDAGGSSGTSRTNDYTGVSLGAHQSLCCMPLGIREIVMEVGNGVLGVEKLEAFINHAQGEADLVSFARQFYTHDVLGLHQQLQDISGRYYQQLRPGSDAEKSFMRLLRKVLDRLEQRFPISINPRTPS